MKTREELRAYQREYMRSYRKLDIYREGHRKSSRNWRKKNPIKQAAISKRGNAKYTVKLKSEAISAYGGICSCCGEHRLPFLTIHHVNFDGARHRKELNHVGFNFYLWLKREKFPNDVKLSVLCMNCNWAVGQGKTCPHQLEKERAGVTDVHSG